jgi:acetyl-CoA carboxylase alpha subunit
LTIIDNIIKEREEKIINIQKQIVSLDEELMNMYKELEYFEEKRRSNQ